MRNHRIPVGLLGRFLGLIEGAVLQTPDRLFLQSTFSRSIESIKLSKSPGDVESDESGVLKTRRQLEGSHMGLHHVLGLWKLVSVSRYDIDRSMMELAVHLRATVLWSKDLPSLWQARSHSLQRQCCWPLQYNVGIKLASLTVTRFRVGVLNNKRVQKRSYVLVPLISSQLSKICWLTTADHEQLTSLVVFDWSA